MKAIGLIVMILFASSMLVPAEKVTIIGNNDIQKCHTSAPLAGTDAEPSRDIAITGDSIVPRLTCKEDGNLILTVRLNVKNLGTTDMEDDFKISIQDDTGNFLEGYWQYDFNGPLPIPASSPNTSGVSILWPLTNRECSIRFSAAIDTAEEIEESSEENNTASLDFTQKLVNIGIDSISSTSAGDGLESIQVVIENTGCGIIDAPFILSVEDNSGNIQRQTITALPRAKHTVTFENWPAACAAEERTFTIIADASDQMCESDAADNTFTATLANTNPDLAVDVAVEMDCQEDGKIRGMFTLKITNSSEVDITKDFFVSIDDGRGWQIEKQFQKELGGNLPIKKGETKELTVDWTRDFSIKPMIMEFPDLQIIVDSKEQIDECDATNNSVLQRYTLQVPNLNLLSFTPTCVTDDYYQVILVIENSGGADIEDDFSIQITDNDEKKQIKTFSEIEGILPFKAGSRQTVLFDTWDVDQAPALLELECRLDYNRQLAETDPNDNNKRGNIQVFDMEITDFKAGSKVKTTKEGQVVEGFFTITITNSGLSAISDDFAIQVVDREGWRTERQFAADLNGVLPLAPGQSQTVTIPWDHDFSIHPPAYTFKNISVIIDSQSDICECDGTNNQAFTEYQYSDFSLLMQIPLSH